LIAERISFGVTTEYYYSGTKLVKQRIGTDENEFYYDAAGRPYAMKYVDGEMYYYILNIQGDVVGLYNERDELVAKYDYDAWGNCYINELYINSAAYENPLRYRGYFYDNEPGWYYFQSRYYDR
jgi:hypothetical protein